MILTLAEAKNFLKVDADITDDDLLIQNLIDAAETHLINAVDYKFDNTNSLAKLYVSVLVNDYYNNRSSTQETSVKTRETLQSILLQLQYCYSET
ncbi:head-tail connector protein [Clostridium felsineum]|uniref:Uncharacterized protein n=1 Tax=Clostridium felsineum TaxID=36839 RepID=A0A1S8M2F4_9CLOT|nr:head-tail connector protein [Clostridium felsineum]URZ06772.1 hypothetical protein CLROS_021050 [Clostridium felsineum]URZ11804.1 hypothetical protein CROST_025210 [Clostridium felsineum]